MPWQVDALEATLKAKDKELAAVRDKKDELQRAHDKDLTALKQGHMLEVEAKKKQLSATEQRLQELELQAGAAEAQATLVQRLEKQAQNQKAELSKLNKTVDLAKTAHTAAMDAANAACAAEQTKAKTAKMATVLALVVVAGMS